MDNTTGFSLTGFRVVREFGTVRGIVVRSRSLIGNIGASLQTLFGGDITLYTDLCEHARQDAYERLCRHATALGPTPSSACGTMGRRFRPASQRFSALGRRSSS